MLLMVAAIFAMCFAFFLQIPQESLVFKIYFSHLCNVKLNFENMIKQQGTEKPQAAEVKRTEEIVRKIVVRKPSSEEVYHVGLQAEKKDGTLKINLGDND